MKQLCVAGGQIFIDHIARVDSLPGVDEVGIYEGFHRQLAREYMGGCSNNMAAAAAKLGVRVHLGDFYSRLPEETAYFAGMHENITLDNPRMEVAGPAICHCYQVYDAENKKLSFMDSLLEAEDADVFAPYKGEWPLLCLAQPAGHRQAPSLAALMARTRQNGQMVALSLISANQPLALELVEGADCLFMNEFEAGRLAGQMGKEDIRALLCGNAKAIFVTRGKAGVFVHTAAGTEEVPPAKEDRRVDATGAGDTFAGAAMAALCRGYATGTAARIGCVASSFVLEEPGAQPGQPGWAKMKERYERCYGKLEDVK